MGRCLCAAWVVLLVVVGGCGPVRIVAPVEVQDPVLVGLIDYGNTSKVLLPRSDGSWGEYGFGEYEWYGKNQAWLIGVPIMLLWPTEGTLARADWPRRPRLWGEAAWWIEVERASAEALVGRLDRVFADGLARKGFEVENFGYRFVPWDRQYWIFQQSTTTVRDWMAELGCETRGWGFRARYVVEGAVASGGGWSALSPDDGVGLLEGEPEDGEDGGGVE